MSWLKIKNWEERQSYRKDRGTPPWIKVYRDVFSNQKWADLSDAEKGQLVSMWVYAADQQGRIPNCPKKLRKMCMLDDEPNLQRFKDLGFLVGVPGRQGDNQVTTKPCQSDAPETETETETETEKPSGGKKKKKSELVYTGEFELLWEHYPSRDGSNSKVKAFEAYTARVKEKVVTPEKAISQVRAYKQWCTHHAKEGTPMVMQCASFFGPKQRGFEGDWSIKPLPKKQSPMDQKRSVVDNWAQKGDGPYDTGTLPGGTKDIL